MAGIYIHIPFCKQKCHYCNFFSQASLKYKDAFVKALLSEIDLKKNYLNDNMVKTIYFGGGTPSLYDADTIQLIIDRIMIVFDVQKDVEITLESNPDDLTKERLNSLAETSVNRLSIGVQSFFDDDLHYLHRVHNSGQAYQAIVNAQNTGFSNLSIDLIYGIPGLTAEKWIKNIRQLFELQIPHISAYALTVEPKTALFFLIGKNKYDSPDEQLTIEHFEILMTLMKENDYLHYEISNFCKDGYFSKHNMNYWSGVPYLGLGPSAHSFNGYSRQWNKSNVSSYISGVLEKGTVQFEKEILTKTQQYNEYILTGLRTIWGCDIKRIESFGERYKNHIISVIQSPLSKGLMVKKQDHLFLTEKGKLFADRLAADLFIID